MFSINSRNLYFILLAVLIQMPLMNEIQAQYVNFGKNRVQYQNFEWRYIQSKHFDVYYYGDKN